VSRRRVSSPVLVGRAAELAELMAALDAATAGRGRLMLVEGEAGIGKSRVIEEFATGARAVARVVVGACLPFADAVPYAAFAPILGELSSGSAVDDHTRSTDAAGRFRFFQSVADRLIAEANAQPVVMVVEDLHWADDSTGDLLLFLATAIRDAPVVIVASRRLEGNRSTGLAAALGEIVRSGRATQLNLDSLDPVEMGELIGRILGVDPSPGLLGRVVHRADGNPFFAEELVAAGGGDELPSTVGDVILQRVARVDPATQHLLRVAAVIGRRVNATLLRIVVEEGTSPPDANVDGALRDALIHQILVKTGDDYAFRHALGHQAIYGDLLPGERAAFHERVARALEVHTELAVGGSSAMIAAELANHWHAAGQVLETLAASARAGQASEQAHAPIEAEIHYRRAIELWPQVPDAAVVAGVDRHWLLERAAESASMAGSHRGAVALADQLLAELDPDRDRDLHTRVSERRVRYLWYAGDVTMSKRATEAIRQDAPTTMTVAAVTRLCGVAYQLALELRYVEALALARDALDAAERVGGPAELSYALHVVGSLEGHLGCYDACLARLHRSLELSREAADPQRIGETWHNLAEAYGFAGRPAEAAAVAEQAVDELLRLGLRRTYVALTEGQLALAFLALGRFSDADDRTGAVLATDAQPYFTFPARLGRLHLLARQGRFGEFDELLDELTGTVVAYDYMGGVGAAWEAEVALWQRDWARARLALDRANAIAASTDEIMLELRVTALMARLHADEFAWRRLTAAARDRSVDVALVDARLRKAKEFLARIERATDCSSLPFHRTFTLARAEMSRLEEPPAPQPWADVAAGAGTDVYLRAYAQWREAEALLAGSSRLHRTRAEALIREAAATASRLGAAPLLAEIGDLARRARVDLATGQPSGDVVAVSADGTGADELAAMGLTRREREVLRLLGQGLSNRDIGAALYISAKTASVHVTHILQKLNVSTRVQAAVAAHRLSD